MPFENDNKKSLGRPKGSPNGTTIKAREQMEMTLALSLDKLLEKIDSLKPSELIELAALCSKHTVPIPKETNEDGSTDRVIKITGNRLR